MKILRVKHVADKLGVAAGTVWRLAKDHADFPKPVKFSENATGWIESEVDAYIAAKVKAVREPLAA